MAKNKDVQKRRVAAAEQAARQQTASKKRERRRQLGVGAVVGFLALALIAPLTAGLIANNSDSTPDTVPPATVPEPIDLPWVPPELEGAAITGATPCPATDGSAERTTSFEEAPPSCIDDGASFDVAFETPAGPLTLPIDSSLNPDVANLVVTLANYQAYESTPLTATDSGLIAVGSSGDTGFTLPVTPRVSTLEDPYPIGSVVALVDVDNTVSGSLVVVANELGSALLATSPTHIVIGRIDDLSEVEAIVEAPRDDVIPLIDGVAVTETS